MRRTAIALLTCAGLAGCVSDKDYARQEVLDSRTFIDQSCGKDQECRQQLAQAEATRIDHDLRERSLQRSRFAAAMQQNAARRAVPVAQPVYVPPQRVIVCGLPANSGRYGC